MSMEGHEARLVHTLFAPAPSPVQKPHVPLSPPTHIPQAYTSQIIAVTMMALQLSEDSISKRQKRDQIIDELGQSLQGRHMPHTHVHSYTQTHTYTTHAH